MLVEHTGRLIQVSETTPELHSFRHRALLRPTPLYAGESSSHRDPVRALRVLGQNGAAGAAQRVEGEQNAELKVDVNMTVCFSKGFKS